MVAPGGAIDVDQFRVLGIDWLGHHPASISAASGSEARSYPLITTQDQARAVVAVLDEIGTDSVHVLVGASYGGMVGLTAAAAYPHRFRRLVVISAAHRTHPMATAHRSLQREIVALAEATGRGSEGLVLARALAMTTYRTAAEFEARFAVEAIPESAGRFEVEEYLLARGRAFSKRFHPQAFAALSHSIDLHTVDPAGVSASVDLISVDSDTLVPTWLVAELEARIGGECRHHRIESAWGHDAFLKEAHAVGQLVSGVLDECKEQVAMDEATTRLPKPARERATP